MGRFHPVPTAPVFASGDPARRPSFESLPRPDQIQPERSNPFQDDPEDIRQKEQREQREELRMENMPGRVGDRRTSPQTR